MMADNQRGGDHEDHVRAGKAGGQATKEKHGPEFYSKIGEEGGKSQGKENNPGNFANDPEKARKAGEKGGRN